MRREAILDLFQDLMPGVTVIAVDHDQYIAESKQHPMIQMQIMAGIYVDIATEFLSVARTFAPERTVEVDVDLILQHMQGVDALATFGYVASVALHEYHHVESHAGPAATQAEQYQREIECDEYLRRTHPEVMSLAQQAEAQSETIQRVYRRMASLALRP